MERRGLVTPQPQQTFSSPAQSTPHKGTPSRRLSTGRGTPFRDEWTAAADHGVQRSQSSGPRPRARRMSESASSGRPADTPKAGLTIKESNVLIDRLQKENFDLKLRMTLQEEKVKKMSKELEDSQERMDMADQLAERCASAEEMAAQLEDQLEQVRARFEETWSHNQELVAISEELTRELIERDGSIVEAANIIHDLEQRIQQLEEEVQTPSAKSFAQRAGTNPDSDYFSGEAESPVVAPTKLKARPSSSSSSSVMPAESDYYSATSYSSPASAVPKKPRPASRRQKSSPLDPAAGGFRRRANSDQTADTATSFDRDSVQPYDGRRSSTVKPPSTLQPAASIQSSPDPPVLRPGLRRTRKGHAAVMQAVRLQNEQQQQQQQPSQTPQQLVTDPTTPRASMYYSNVAIPGPAPVQAAYPATIAQRKQMHSATPTQYVSRFSEAPTQDWRTAVAATMAATQAQQQQQQGARPLRSLYMTGELSRPVTSDTHNHYGDMTQLRIPGQAPAEATPTVLSPAATPANDHSDNDDSGASTSRPSTTIAAGAGPVNGKAPAVAGSATPARPIIWRDRSNMSSLALAATNAAARLQRAGLVAHDDAADGASDSGSGSPTATIPDTISSRVDVAAAGGDAAKRAARLGQLGSEYSLVSTGSYGGLFGRDVLFRP